MSFPDRNRFVRGGLLIKPIADFRIFDGFFCCPDDAKDKDMDAFIHDGDAKRHFRDKVAVTYGLFYEDNERLPLGFATLQNDDIKIQLQGYEYKNMPAVKIGRFGIRREIHRRKFGTRFLTVIREFMSQPDNRTGCRFLTLSTFPPLIPFYEKNNFTVLGGKPAKPRPSKQLIMYLDLAHPSIHR